MPFSLFYVRPALIDQTGGGVADSTQTAESDSTQVGDQTGPTSSVKTVQAVVWGQEDFLARASRFLDGVLPVVVAGKAQRLNQNNAGLDKSRRLIAELVAGTVVFMRNEDIGNDEAPYSPPMVVVKRHGNSYQLRWGGSGTLLERLVPVHRLKIAPRGTEVDGIYEVEQILDHRPAEVGPEARLIEYWVKWKGFDRADSTWEPGDSCTSRRRHRRHQRLLGSTLSGDIDQHATFGSPEEAGSSHRQVPIQHHHALTLVSLTRGMGLGRDGGLAGMVWGLGYLQTVPVVFM
jgi:hypothetical protein